MVTVKFFTDSTQEEFEYYEVECLVDFIRQVNVPKSELVNLRFFKGDVLGNEIDTSDGSFIHIEDGEITVIDNKSIPRGDPVTWVYVTIALISAYAAVKLSKLDSSVSTSTTADSVSAASSTNSLGATTNELVTVNSRIDDIFGTVVKHVPKMWQTPYRIGVNNQETEIQFLCVGRGKYLLDEDTVRDGTSKFLNIPGAAVNFFEPGTWPGNGTPSLTIGNVIDRPIGIYRESSSLNSSELLPPNDLTLGDSAVWTVEGDSDTGTFTLTNASDLDVDLTEYLSVGQNLSVLDVVTALDDTINVYRFENDTSRFGVFSNQSYDTKFQRGVLAEDGFIYAMGKRDNILKVDTVNKTTSLISFNASGSGDYSRFNAFTKGSDDLLYASPGFLGGNILEFDTSDNSRVTYSTSAFHESPNSYPTRWGRFTEGSDGKLYAPPHSELKILVFDPVTKVISTIALTNYSGQSFASYFTLGGDGNLYSEPVNIGGNVEGVKMIKLNTSTGVAEQVDPGFELNDRGAPVKGVDGNIYFVPGRGESVAKYDVNTGQLSRFGSLNTFSSVQWLDGALADNGKIYCMPYDSSSVLEIDTVNETLSQFGSYSGQDKWIGATKALDGKIYGMPYDDEKVLEIDSVQGVQVFKDMPLNQYISGDYEITNVDGTTVTVSGFNYLLEEQPLIDTSYVMRNQSDGLIAFLTDDTDAPLYSWTITSNDETVNDDNVSSHQNDIGQSFDNVLGPYVLDEGATEIIVNLTSLSGFYKINGSSYVGIEAQVRITIEELNEDDLPTGNQVSTVVDYDTHSTSTTSSVYQSYEIEVPYDYARVYAARITDRDKSSNITNIDQIEWTYLYTFQPNPDDMDLGDVTTMHVLVPSNSQSRLIKSRQTNLDVTRLITQYQGDGVFGAEESYATDDFDQILIHTALDPYNGRLTIDDIGADNLLSLHDEIIAYSGDETMVKFGYDFDDNQLAYDDMFTMVCDVVGCIPYIRDSKYDAFHEGEQTESSMQITHRNKVPGTEKRSDDFTKTYDGVELTYRSNEEDGDNLTIYVPSDRSAQSPETIQLLGCTTELQAQQYADRMYFRQIYQRTTVTFDTDEFGRMITPGQRIDSPDGTRFSKFADYEDGYRVYDGEVVEVNGLNVELSQPVQFTEGENHYIQFTNSKGDNSELIQCYENEGDEFLVTLANTPTETIYDGYERDRTKFTFCSEQLRGSIALIPVSVDIKLDSDNKETVSLSMKNYSSEVYQNDVRADN